MKYQLKITKCRACASDMRVTDAVSKKSASFYPDVVVTCGERKFDDEKKDVLLNPTVVIEVLSKSTKLKDRNEKFESYTALESLTDYVLVEQNPMRIEHYTRIDEQTWKVQLLSKNSTNSFSIQSIVMFLWQIFTMKFGLKPFP